MRRMLEGAWSRVGFEEPAFVDRLLMVGTLSGVVGAVLCLAALSGLTVGGFAVAGAAAVMLLTVPRLHYGWRLALALSTTLLVAVVSPRVSLVPFFFSVPLGLVLALEPLSAWRRLLAFVGPSVGAAWCLLVAQGLGAKHLGALAGLSWVALGSAGLFIALGSALAWVTIAADAVEPQLVVPRVRQAWQRLRRALQRVGDDAARARLDELSREGAQRWISARAEHAALLAGVDVTLEEETRSAVRALEDRLETTDDGELQTHLAQLLRVHRDTLEQLDSQRRRLERAEARVAAEAGWLETAAFSIELAPRNAVGLGDLAQRLVTLATR
jgi:hypothetical protein